MAYLFDTPNKPEKVQMPEMPPAQRETPQASREELEAGAKRGRLATIMTSGRGLFEPPPLRKKTLLGE